MTRVSRDLHWVPLIAADEDRETYLGLTPSVLLHDFECNNPGSRRLRHDVTGARMADNVLSPLGYDIAAIKRTHHGTLAHKGMAGLPTSLKAMIFYTARVLEQADLRDPQ
jgi:HD superfamily phosphodiesterase